MTISGFVAYVKQLWRNKPDTSTPLSADRLLHIESGIKMNSDGIEKIAAAVVSQITNDANKIASMAALYAVNQQVTTNKNNITQLGVDLNSKTWVTLGGPGSYTLPSSSRYFLCFAHNSDDTYNGLYIYAPLSTNYFAIKKATSITLVTSGRNISFTTAGLSPTLYYCLLG